MDAVFAAFSQDNLAISTNYELHGFNIGRMLRDNIMLDAVLYHYRPLRAAYAGTNSPDDWLDRVRLNLSFLF